MRHFTWTSAGLFCVAPSALLFTYFSSLLKSGSLVSRLQLLWNGSGDVDSNAVTYNNVLHLAVGYVANGTLPPMPHMGEVEASWVPTWRDIMHLPRSKMGVREVPTFLPGYPALALPSTNLAERLCRFCVPLDDYRRMDVDGALVTAPEDVQRAMMDVRAALLDGDTSNRYLVPEVDYFMSARTLPAMAIAACFRCNDMLPLETAMFTAARGAEGQQRLGGVAYDLPHTDVTEGYSSVPPTEPEPK
jgi:hypothetical protein